MNFLAIDIGNSNTVLGIFSGESLLGEWRMSTYPLLSPKAIQTSLRLFCKEVGIQPDMIGAFGIASVVPRATSRFARTFQKLLSVEPLIVSGRQGNGMRLRYSTPGTLGADRICHAVAGYDLYGGPVLVVDCGTATTIDAVSKNGTYLGGIIFPGLATLANALHYFTAQLPVPPLEFPDKIIGTDTMECLQAGIMFGGIDAIEGLIRRMKTKVGKNAKVIATGGYAPLVAPHIRLIDFVNPSLVLEGIRLIHKRIAHPRIPRRSGR